MPRSFWWMFFGVGVLIVGLWLWFDRMRMVVPEASTGEQVPVALIGLGVVAIGVGAALALRRGVTPKKKATLGHGQEDNTMHRELHVRYERAAAQFGDEQASIKIDGIYALEALAKEWGALDDGSAQRDECIDLLVFDLCASPTFVYPDGEGSGVAPASTDFSAKVMTADEVDVRQAIVKVIARNLCDVEDPKKPGLWSDHFFDFSGADFAPNADFKGAIFDCEVRFYTATFAGDADFDKATFVGNANFGGATFSGNASFGGATFGGNAIFDQTQFSDIARFTEAVFSEDAGFGGASFSGPAGFDGATFSGDTRFDGVIFSGDAVFSGATFGEDAIFGGVTFCRDVSFDGATFTGFTSFDETEFGRGARFGGVTSSSEADLLAGVQVLSPFLVEPLLELGVGLQQPITGTPEK